MALISLAFVACNKEENKETPKEETHSIEGTWYFKSLVTNGEPETMNECGKQNNMTFSQGKWKASNYDQINEKGDCENRSSEGTYTISGNTLTIKASGKENIVTFSIIGDILTLSGKNEKGIDTIVSWKKR